MLLLTFLLVPIVLIAAEEETIINNYIVKIIDDTLISVQPTEKSSDKLNLSGLGLRVLKKEAFGKLPTLQTLNLANNSLSDISKDAFSRPISLEHLSLANNNIARFKYAFGGMKHLKTLNISNNPIDKLRYGELYGLSKFCVISTTGLSFSTIDSHVFDKPPKWHYEIVEDDFEVIKEPSTSSYDDSDEITYKMCIQDDVLKMVAPIKKNETMPNGCQLRKTGFQGISLSLRGLGIAKFAKGWYRLEDTSIKVLDIRTNKITEITKEILNDLPPNIEEILLDENKIEHLKKGIIENKYIRVLSLTMASLRKIEEGAFANINCITILLNFNQLKDTMIKRLTSVLELNMESNQIAELTPGSFVNAGHLIYLNLNTNLIQELKEDSLHGLQNLTSLYLNSNRITNIHPGCFQHTPKLTSISLRNNSIATFEQGLFNNLRNLNNLYVQYNKLSNVKENFPDGLPASLDILRLDFNAIEKLERGAFTNVPKTELTLTGNKISKIEQGSFDLPGLRTLNLDNNTLIEIDADSFQGLNDIETLSLKANGIKKIPRGFTKYLRHLKVLQIGSNPITRLGNSNLPGIRSSVCKIVIHVENTPIEIIEGGLFNDM